MTGSKKVFHDLRALWNSRRSTCQRTATLFLLLICATTIFSTAIVQILVVLFSLTVTVCLVRTRPISFRRTPLDLPYATFVAARILSIAFSQDRALSVTALYIEYFYYLVFFLVTQTLASDIPSDTLWAVGTLTFAGLAASVFGISKVLFSLSSVASPATAGTYTLGAYLCAILPLAVVLGHGQKTSGSGVPWWVPPTIMCLAIILTLDRLHWAGMAFMFLIMTLVYRGKPVMMPLLLAVPIAMLFPTVWMRLGTLLHLSQNMAGRDIIWRGAVMLIGNHPLTGFGPRTFTEIFPLFNEMRIRGVSSWHNDYLQVYMESGILALIPLLWIIGTVYFQGWRQLRSGQLSPEKRNLFLALGLSLTAIFLVGGMFDTLVGITFRTVLGMYALMLSRSPRTPWPNNSFELPAVEANPPSQVFSHVMERSRR